MYTGIPISLKTTIRCWSNGCKNWLTEPFRSYAFLSTLFHYLILVLQIFDVHTKPGFVIVVLVYIVFTSEGKYKIWHKQSITCVNTTPSLLSNLVLYKLLYRTDPLPASKIRYSMHKQILRDLPILWKYEWKIQTLFQEYFEKFLLSQVDEGYGYCTREIKMTIAIAKEAFNIKMSLLTSKLNIELRKKLVRCYVWSIALYGSEIWSLRKLEYKYLQFGNAILEENGKEKVREIN